MCKSPLVLGRACGSMTSAHCRSRLLRKRHGDEAEDAPAPESRVAIFLEDATRIVRQTHSGRVVSATRERGGQGGETKVRSDQIRVNVKGHVKTVFADQRERILES